MNGFSNSGRKPQNPKEARTSCETVAEARVDNICNNSNNSSICNNSNNSNILDLASNFFSFPLSPKHEALNP